MDGQIIEEPLLPARVPAANNAITHLIANDPYQSLENITNALLSSGLGEKYLEMVRHAKPIGPDGEWNHDDITVLLKVGEVASRFLTKLNRAGSRRRRGAVDSIEDTQKKIEALQAELDQKQRSIDDARAAWQRGGVNRRGA